MANKHPSSTVMNPSPKLLASFCKSAKPLRFSSLDIYEYRDEFIDFEVGMIKGGILVSKLF